MLQAMLDYTVSAMLKWTCTTMSKVMLQGDGTIRDFDLLPYFSIKANVTFILVKYCKNNTLFTFLR